MPAKKKPQTPKSVQTLTHGEEKRRNIPTAEFQAMVERGEPDPLTVAYERRNCDLDPQLIWRGKDIRDWSDLVVPAPPLYIQEKVHPKVLIDDLKRVTASHPSPAGRGAGGEGVQLDLFGDFNGVPEGADKTDFYAHDQNWSNRMILGDSLQVMASLAEREGLRGKVQCIYFDTPTASNSTPTSNGPPLPATSRTAKPTTSPANLNRSKPSATPGATASTPTSPTSATASPSRATCSPTPAPSSSKSATKTSTACARSWMRCLGMGILSAKLPFKR